MTTALQLPFSDLEKMAMAVAKSGLFGIKTPEQGIALMLIAQAEGLHPALAARDYDIIQGRPALKARAMLSRFQMSGGVVDWRERSDTAAEAAFSHPQSPTPVVVRWDMERAGKAGLGGKDMWRKFPRQMLSARVISEGVATCYPAATSGLYVPEEISDFDDQPAKPTAKKPPVKSDTIPTEVVGRKTEEATITPSPVAVVESEATPPSKITPPVVETQPCASNEEVAAKPPVVGGAIVAGEIKKIRELAGQLKCKSSADACALVSGLIGREVQSSTDLSGGERLMAIEGMENMLQEAANG
jgi:hypothetical protein